MTVANGFTQSRIDAVELASGERLEHAQFEQLVSAMAAFDPESFGSVGLNDDAREELAPTIAAGWKAA